MALSNSGGSIHWKVIAFNNSIVKCIEISHAKHNCDIVLFNYPGGSGANVPNYYISFT
jgi:hypothetical protein